MGRKNLKISNFGQFSQNCHFLAPWCIKIDNHRATQHEFIHAFGFLHEHSRFDRDTYLTILWKNIRGGRDNHNFWKANEVYDNVVDIGSYDGRSIMHYTSKNSFAIKDGLDTMKSLVRIHFL